MCNIWVIRDGPHVPGDLRWLLHTTDKITATIIDLLGRLVFKSSLQTKLNSLKIRGTNSIRVSRQHVQWQTLGYQDNLYSGRQLGYQDNLYSGRQLGYQDNLYSGRH